MDRRLVERAIEGDRDAFASLALLVSDSLYAVAYRILRDPGLAEDALQNTLVMAWRHLDGLRDPDRFEAWICRVLVDASYAAQARRRGRETATVRRISMTDELVDDGAAVIDRDEIERAFRRLSAEHRAIRPALLPRDCPWWNRVDLGIPGEISHARSRLHYAIRALRALMQPDRRATLEEVNLGMSDDPRFDQAARGVGRSVRRSRLPALSRPRWPRSPRSNRPAGGAGRRRPPVSVGSLAGWSGAAAVLIAAVVVLSAQFGGIVHPGGSSSPGILPTAAPTRVPTAVDTTRWTTFTSNLYGYSFRVPQTFQGSPGR